ncbi:hypothetical protein GGR09_000472 [Bartonella heixiaziensis]
MFHLDMFFKTKEIRMVVYALYFRQCGFETKFIRDIHTQTRGSLNP